VANDGRSRLPSMTYVSPMPRMLYYAAAFHSNFKAWTWRSAGLHQKKSPVRTPRHVRVPLCLDTGGVLAAVFDCQRQTRMQVALAALCARAMPWLGYVGDVQYKSSPRDEIMRCCFACCPCPAAPAPMSSSRVTCDLKPAQATGQAAMAGLALLDRSPIHPSQAASQGARRTMRSLSARSHLGHGTYACRLQGSNSGRRRVCGSLW
jgi:hypothetical protein